MKKVDAERSSIALFISAVTVSALTMLWMLWHFPIVTATTALLVLVGVALAARVAKTLDGEAGSGGHDPKSAA
jgi:hypothetical protein